MQLKLKLLLLVSSFFVFQLFSKAQSANVKEFDYYIKFKEKLAKPDKKYINETIKQKNSVVKVFMSNPLNPYYIIKSKVALTKESLQNWFISKYTISVFEITNTNDVGLMKKLRSRNKETKN
jgi:hypothetical protein